MQFTPNVRSGIGREGPGAGREEEVVSGLMGGGRGKAQSEGRPRKSGGEEREGIKEVSRRSF